MDSFNTRLSCWEGQRRVVPTLKPAHLVDPSGSFVGALVDGAVFGQYVDVLEWVRVLSE